MSEMKRCPICGKEVADEYRLMVFIEERGVWYFSHYCDHEVNELSVSIGVWGKTRAEVIERWNHRAEVEKSESL